MPVEVLSVPVPELTLWKVTWPAPMSVLVISSAVPFGALMVLATPCTVTVPPPMA
jgi:hypothetical protein